MCVLWSWPNCNAIDWPPFALLAKQLHTSNYTQLYTLLYHTILCSAILCYGMLCYTILYYTILYYTKPYYTMLYSYYTILYSFYSHLYSLLGRQRLSDTEASWDRHPSSSVAWVLQSSMLTNQKHSSLFCAATVFSWVRIKLCCECF